MPAIATIEFANRLDLESTIHWHGLPVPPDQDGGPLDPVAPGANRVYAFNVAGRQRRIHGSQFQVVSRSVAGASVPEPHRAWFDTVNVPARETVTIKVRQTLAGKRMFHCHILPHEDAGMMTVLDVKGA